ncbi:hypothetical protein [Demequina lutea]|uniref:Uncharacterized protein n=1 Tax=Demequina lutea TaxID=431489 RepID=A0A7Y9Z7I6_9MICO|nr:hypothetical protein [Demequina lutea]NYI40267.1 hypothetical protein [Demequina lutea]
MTVTTVTPAAVTVAPKCGANNDTVNIPTTTGVTYATVGWKNNSITITASANSGYKLTGTTSWTFTDAATSCSTTVTPDRVTVAPACGPNNDTVTIPTKTGVWYSTTGWHSNSVTITAHANAGYTLTGTTSWTFTDDATACSTTVTPAAVTVAPKCGANNDTVNIPTKTGVNYTSTGWHSNSITITAHANAGYTLTGTTSWTFTDAATACAVTVTPPPVTVVPTCGPNNDTVTIPTKTGVWYSTTGWKNNSITITAHANAGYTLTGTTSWTFTDAATSCSTTVTPPPVTVVPTCGPNNDTVTIPSATGVWYSTTGWHSNSITLTAHADAGYTLTGTTSWTFTDDAIACPTTVVTVTPDPVTVAPACGPDNDTVTIPTTTGVSYTSTGWHSNSITITANANAGYTLTGTTSWTFTDAATACPVTAVAALVVDPPLCGPDNDVINIPTTTGVTYSDTGWVSGSRTITAHAASGYTLTGTSSWTFNDAATVCPVVTPEPPTVVAQCLPNNDTVTIPTTTGVTYSDTGWSGGTRTITAAAASGYTLTGTSTWTFTDVPSVGCPPITVFSGPDLAFTGTPDYTGGLVALAIFLIASGAVLAVRKVRA